MLDLTPAPMTAARRARIHEIRDMVRDTTECNPGNPTLARAFDDLLAELDRHRAATAAELRGLLKTLPPLHPPAMDDRTWGEGYAFADREHLKAIHSAAARLGLTL